MASWFPIFIDIEDRPVAVIGAGRIASRRIKTLLEFGAKITVTAPSASKEVAGLADEGRLVWNRGTYEFLRPDLSQCVMVLSATGDGMTDRLVYDDCKALGIPVNTASDKEMCDFYFPGTARGGGVTAGVTASGHDHRLAAKATRQIQKLLDEEGTDKEGAK